MHPDHPNPVFRQLIARSRWPSHRLTIILFVIISVGAAWFAAFGFLDSDVVPFFVLSIGIGLGALVVLIVSPAVAGVITALGAGQAVESEMHSLMLISDVTNSAFVRGHIAAAVYRLRLLWAICFGLLPAAFISMLVEPQVMCSSCSISFRDVTSAVMLTLYSALLGMILSFLTISAAVIAALLTRKTRTAVVASLCTLGGTYLLMLVLVLISANLRSNTEIEPLVIIAICAVTLALCCAIGLRHVERRLRQRSFDQEA